MFNNTVPSRLTYVAPGTVIAILNCTWFMIQNLSTEEAAYVWVRNFGDDDDAISNIVLPQGSINQSIQTGSQQMLAQVVIDGTDAGFTISYVGQLSDTVYGTAADLAAAGYL